MTWPHKKWSIKHVARQVHRRTPLLHEINRLCITYPPSFSIRMDIKRTGLNIRSLEWSLIIQGFQSWIFILKELRYEFVQKLLSFIHFFTSTLLYNCDGYCSKRWFKNEQKQKNLHFFNITTSFFAEFRNHNQKECRKCIHIFQFRFWFQFSVQNWWHWTYWLTSRPVDRRRL